MRIPLVVRTETSSDGKYKYTRPFVERFSIRARDYRVFGLISWALVDTGGPRTFISLVDAERLGIPFKKVLVSEPEEIDVASFRKAPLYPMRNIILRFRDEENRVKKVEIPKIMVFRLPFSKFLEKDKEIAKHIPTIIGTDFLEEAGFAMYFNPRDKIAYLEEV